MIRYCFVLTDAEIEPSAIVDEKLCSDMQDRLDIISGNITVDSKKAKEIMSETTFYRGVNHSYNPSICGRACDIACYIHLEEKGILTKKFKTPFRKRKEWKFNIKDFK